MSALIDPRFQVCQGERCYVVIFAEPGQRRPTHCPDCWREQGPAPELLTTVCSGCRDVVFYHPDMAAPEYCHPCRAARAIPYLEGVLATFVTLVIAGGLTCILR